MDERRIAGDPDFYFARLAAAYVRERLAGSPMAAGHAALFARPLDALGPEQLAALVRLGLGAGLRLHRFKRTMELPRVRRALGILRGLAPTSLLDVGSGRGAFLWPLLDAFPGLPVTAIDLLDHRVADIQAVRDGGVATLSALRGDATALSFADGAFDVATMLEVLEHIPDTQRALAEVCRVARRCVVLSVPSKPDDNPEHIHLFDSPTLVSLVRGAGMARVSVEHVLNHRIVVARSENA